MKRNGFTLIELLAVIVILSVISLITIPIVTGVIDTSRRNSFKVTCMEIYDSYDTYVVANDSIGKNNSNIIFDFSSKRQNTEIIGDIKYEPVSKLYLKGELPNNGKYQIKNDKRTLKADNGRYTCVIDENRSEILGGTVEENDTTAPVINDVVITSTTNSIKVVVDAIEEDGVIAKYYYKFNGEEIVSENNSKTYTNLKANEEYEIEVVVENKSGLKSNKVVKKIMTKSVSNPTIKQTVQTPSSGYSYAQSRTIQITYSNTNVNSPVYYFKSSVGATVASGVVTASCGTGTNPGTCTSSSVTTIVANTWYKTTSTTPSVIYKANGTLYALTSDGANISGTSTFTISKIDTSAPSASMSVGSIKTDRATITATCSDAQSGITKYEYSKDNGTTWITNGTTNSYTFTGLTKETSYKYKIRCTNGSGLTKEASSTSSTLGFTNPTIKQTSQTPTSGTWATSRTIQITYSNTNVTSPVYYFKSSVGATVASGVVTAACGTGTNPGTCTSSNITTLVANTWYKTTSTTPSVTYKANGTLYALTSDGANISGTSTFTISKIDTSAPSASMSVGSIKTDRATITATCSDAQSGITKYEYSKDNGTTWISNGTTNSYTFTGLTKETSYQYKIRCTNGSGLTKEASSTSSTLGFTNPTIKQTSQTPSSGTWATSRTIQITYSNTNVNSPVYYFKSSVGATVASGVVTAACGTGTNPGTCTSSNITTLVANTWYKTTSTTPSVIYRANGTLYALTSDGKNISGTSTFTISKIDTSAPSIYAYSGTMLYQDPYFTLGTNSTSIYNNLGNGTVTITRKEMSGTYYGYGIEISTTGTASPGHGGFTFYTVSAANKELITIINAKIPVGYQINWASNEVGNGGVFEWLTSQAGTGNWQTYIFRLKCGSSGTFATTNFFYLTGGSTATTSSPVTWQVQLATTIDTTKYGASNFIVFAGKDTESGVAAFGVNQSSTTEPSWTATNVGWWAGGYTSNRTYYVWIKDALDNVSKVPVTLSYIDNVTTPTVTYNGGSNSHSWKNNYNITLTSTATSGIHHYEVDWDGDGIANQTITSNFIPWDGYSSCNNRFRAVSNNGVESAWTSSHDIHMDTSAPGATTITYNGGANTCIWKNNYNLTLTSTDNVGVSYYQIDTNNDGVADTTVGSSFIPTNGWSTCTARFRAVDGAGNVGPWTEKQHIHMDTEKPVHTNWWWGEVTKDVARLYVQATDNVGLPANATTYDGHNAGVYCPTSTQSGGYTNFVWFKGNWDASANAYRCDITPSTFGHYGQTYRTHLYIYDYVGNGGYYNATSVNIPTPSYAATNSSYAATPNTTTYPTQPTGETYRCCWHISSANASKSQCASDTIVDYEDGSGRWECDQCSTCPRKACTNGGTQNGDICTKTEYTCPNGGTLSGTTCVLYTCPNGGTLSGTTCVK